MKRPKPDPPLRLEKRITSLEDWYPTVDERVTVALVELFRTSPTTRAQKEDRRRWRVYAIGGDDFHLGRDFNDGEFDQAKELYDRLIDCTLQEEMRSWGMGPL